jgi:hypothetical protein
MLASVSAHGLAWLQRATYGRPLRLAEQSATLGIVELDTANACRFAVRHAWNRR